MHKQEKRTIMICKFREFSIGFFSIELILYNLSTGWKNAQGLYWSELILRIKYFPSTPYKWWPKLSLELTEVSKSSPGTKIKPDSHEKAKAVHILTSMEFNLSNPKKSLSRKTSLQPQNVFNLILKYWDNSSI